MKKIKKQNTDAAEVMGCDYVSMDYISSSMPSQEDFINELVEYFKEEKVDLVITHWMGTLHPRHYYTYYTVTEAVKRCRKEGINIQLLYGECCEDLIGFLPQKYYTLEDDEVCAWFEGLKRYSIFNGEVNDVPYYDYYKTSGKVRGMEVGTEKFTKAYMNASLVENI